MSILRVIIVEDSEDDLLLILRALKKGGFETIYTCVETEEALRAALDDPQWQLIISDHAMPRFSAPGALKVLKESGRDLPFIIVSGTIGEEIAVNAMKAGAHDYIMKGNLSRLVPAIERELRDADVRNQHRQYQKQLEYLTLHDQLTGLYNRVYFENELAKLDGGNEYPVAVISADLDGLMLINETFGQKEGDMILKTCAALLEKPLRKSDVLARVGGDEFITLLPRSDANRCEKIVAQITHEIDELNKEHGRIPISVSIGCSICHDQSEKLDDCVKEAISKMRFEKQNRAESARSQVVNALLAALSERDYIASGHAERIQELCRKMAEEVGLDQRAQAALSMLSQVHDLGKVGIPDQILFKEGGLTEEEWEIMRQHPEKGYRIAQSSPELAHIADLILRHHERFDGSGYPLGLQGEEIPIECRILSIVDSYDAMTNDRPYRKAMARDEALAEIRLYAGSQFDPVLADIFLKIV